MNKDHENLPQINLALLFGETTGLPVCYRKLPGDVKDVVTCEMCIVSPLLDIYRIHLFN